MENRNLIYGLRDPRNDVYCYIGKTTVGTERPINHLTHSHNKNVVNWVLNLKDKGLEPFIDIIEENIDLDNLREREIFWINEKKKNNPDLFNTQLIETTEIFSISEIDWDKIEELKKILSNIPHIVKGIRIKYGLQQEELGKLCGLSRSTISEAENEKNSKLSISNLLKIINIGAKINYTKKENKRLRITRIKR